MQALRGTIRLFLVLAIVALALGCEREKNDATNPLDGDTDLPPTSDGDAASDGDADTHDADKQPDGDSEYTDVEREVFSCSGSCRPADPTACFDLTLCVCDNGEYRYVSCASICEENGLGAAVGCGFDNMRGAYACTCSQPDVVCDADHEITHLPYTHRSSTKRQGNDFGLTQSCFSWGLLAEDVVYAITLAEGARIDITLEPLDASFDPALVLANWCSNLSSCLEGRDRKWEGQSESLSFTAPEAGRYFIVIDSGYHEYDERSSGNYELLVDGILPTDGDVDASEYESETELDSDPDGDLDGGEAETWDKDAESDLETEFSSETESSPETDAERLNAP